MLGGSPTGEAAARYGTSRQSVHSWRRSFEQEGMPGCRTLPCDHGTVPRACLPRWKPRSASCVACLFCGSPAGSPSNVLVRGWR
ncbi:hypothetical protein ACIQ9Q_34735 [Streptomyces sp. NPDC094438]|uniref:hypothetical protein n=1 Tax=Streptomyces sp. NPDC094438 TaxID=3366061 RepID=UPI0038054612